jgi:hypothetical protein
MAGALDGKERVDIIEGVEDGPLLVWVAYLYGYQYTGLTRRRHFSTFHFQRDDRPEPRRRGAWMRAPHLDPSFPPPVSWSMNATWGLTPPGWYPGVRISPPPEQEMKDLRDLVMFDMLGSNYGWLLLVCLLPGAVAVWGQGLLVQLVAGGLIAIAAVASLVGKTVMTRRYEAGAKRARFRLGLTEGSAPQAAPPGPPYAPGR